MSITIQVPDGRRVELPTDDLEVAKKAAANWAVKNPAPEIDTTELAARLDEEDVSTLGDMAKGIPAGILGAIEGVITLPAELIDYATLDEGEESIAEGIRDVFDTITPTTRTGAGNAVKFVTQFVVPGTVASKLAAARNIGRLGQIGAFGAADVAATTPDVETLGDFFETGPTQRIETEDLVGAELAAANLANRFKVASEGTALLLGGPAVIKAAAKGFGSMSEAVAKTDMAQAAAEGIRARFLDDVGTKADLENPTFLSRNIKKVKNKIAPYIRYRNDLPDDMVQTLRHLKISSVASGNKTARNSVEEITHGLEVLNKNGLLNETDQVSMLDALNDFLFPVQKGKTSRETIQSQGEKFLKDIDKRFGQAADKKRNIIGLNVYGTKGVFGHDKGLSFFKSAKTLRDDIDNLSRIIKDDLTDPIDLKLNKALTDVIENNMNFYGRTVYRAGHDVNFEPLRNADGTINAIKQEKYNRAVDNILNNNMADSREAAQKVLAGIEKSVKSFSNANMKPKDMTSDEVLEGISTGILKGKKLDNLPAVRDYLGEYTGAKNIYGVIGRTKQADGTFKSEFGKIRQQTLEEQKLGLQYRVSETVSKMNNLIGQTKYYKGLRDYNDYLDPNKKFLFDEVPRGANYPDYEMIGSYKPGTTIPTEGSIMRYGPLSGKWVKKEYSRAFHDIPQYINLAEANKLYATFLGMKGMSQVMKTVYSPITQIRNATTAALFAIKNGNFGNGEDLVNSAKVVFQNINDNIAFAKGTTEFKASGAKIANKEQIKNYYKEMIDLGVVNTNAKIGEFEDLLGDAAQFGYAPGFAKKGLQWVQDTQNRFSGKLYQGSDDVWKIYSYQMELGRLKKAFENSTGSFQMRVTDPENLIKHQTSVRNGMINLKELSDSAALEFLKRESAEIVKDTVPNYARVPEFIKRLRQMPFGNFIAFPAEIIRTSGNIYGRAIKELASESPEMRAIGMRRLMGSITVDAVMPASLVSAGLTLTGSDREQLNAYRRSMAQDYDRYSVLVPVSTDKDGNIREFYNFSYTNPYDYLTRPARALYDAVNNGITSEKELTDIATHAMSESFWEMFSPFMSESIITEKIWDLRSNKTRYDRPIWREGDSMGVQWSKGLAHLADGLTPGAFPIKLRGDVSGQDIQIGDFPLGADFKDFPRAVGLATGLDPVTGVNRQGIRIDAAGEFAEALSGLKSIKPRVETVLKYRGYEAGNQVREASGIFNSIAKAKSNMSPEDTTQAYISANESKFKALRDLNMAIEDARTLGVPDHEIRKALKAANTPNVAMLMAGKFKPFYPSAETIRVALQENDNKLSNPFDFRALGKERSKQYGRYFLPEKEEAKHAERVRVLREQMEQQAQPPAPQVPQVQPPQPGQTPTAPTAGANALRQVELNKLLGVR